MKLLPTGFPDFEKIRKLDCVYVDKTDLIANLIKNSGCYLLARPRRFGKSTLLSTIHTFFEKGLKAFDGLKLANCSDLLESSSYKIIHLDFSLVKPIHRSESFNDAFVKHLLQRIKDAGLVASCTDNKASLILGDALEAQETASVVLLIDEYDTPLTSVFDNEKEFNYRKDVLNDFYLAVKAYDGYFKLVFMTGIVRFPQLSIFSGFNNLQDISFDPKYGAIVGFTQDELESYFSEHIYAASKALNEKHKTNIYTRDYIINKLRLNYAGYSFDKKASYHVYNSWSVLCFLKRPERGFRPYWVESGDTTPALLCNYIKQCISDGKTFKILNLDDTTNQSTVSLTPDFDIAPSSMRELYAILFQAGYYSIKSKTVVRDMLNTGIPNAEVKKSIAKLIVCNLAGQETFTDLDLKYSDDFLMALDNNDIDSLKSTICALYNEISYESIKDFTEAMFRDYLRLVFILFGKIVQTEVHSALGRADLIITTNSALYVIEIKVAKSENEVETKRQEAKQQLIERKYADRLTNLDIVPLVMVILNQAKTENCNAKFNVEVLERVKL